MGRGKGNTLPPAEMSYHVTEGFRCSARAELRVLREPERAINPPSGVSEASELSPKVQEELAMESVCTCHSEGAANMEAQRREELWVVQ